MGQINIKINIGDRTYPLVVDQTEEPRLREAERVLTEKYKEYATAYPAADKQDHLAMAALFIANSLISIDGKSKSEMDELAIRLRELEQMLDTTLSQQTD
jgi:cell division protein ZapA (FtsZ GTPase activity inhibitor)